MSAKSMASSYPVKSREYLCEDCNECVFNDAPFMLVNTIWLSIATKRTLLCFDCTEKRLGRKINLSDLTNAPINRAFFRGKEMEWKTN